jgi:hypothetical protein
LALNVQESDERVWVTYDSIWAYLAPSPVLSLGGLDQQTPEDRIYNCLGVFGREIVHHVFLQGWSKCPSWGVYTVTLESRMSAPRNVKGQGTKQSHSRTLVPPGKTRNCRGAPSTSKALSTPCSMRLFVATSSMGSWTEVNTFGTELVSIFPLRYAF